MKHFDLAGGGTIPGLGLGTWKSAPGEVGPVIREAIGYANALYGFKSGFDRAGLALGLKSGGYWPGNAEKGLTNHQSTIFLFDADTGRARADNRHIGINGGHGGQPGAVRAWRESSPISGNRPC